MRYLAYRIFILYFILSVMQNLFTINLFAEEGNNSPNDKKVKTVIKVGPNLEFTPIAETEDYHIIEHRGRYKRIYKHKNTKENTKAFNAFIHKIGNKEKTIKTMKEEIAREPNNLDGRIALANFYAMWRMSEEALEQYEYCAKHSPKNADISRAAGILAIQCKQYEKASSYLKKAIKIKPYDSLMHEQLGNAYYLVKDYENGKREYEISEMLGASNPHVFKKKIEFIESLKNDPNGIEWFLTRRTGIAIKDGKIEDVINK